MALAFDVCRIVGGRRTVDFDGRPDVRHDVQQRQRATTATTAATTAGGFVCFFLQKLLRSIDVGHCETTSASL